MPSIEGNMMDAARFSDHSHSHVSAPSDLGHDVAECPVMVGRPVVKSRAEAVGLYRDHKGRRFWLCCKTCGDLFDADPDRYAAAL